MATLTPTLSGVGRGAQGAPLFYSGPRVAAVRTYSFDFDSSYPTGGEDIGDIFDEFSELLQIIPSTVANRVVVVDYTAQTLMLYTALGTQAGSGTDQSSITGVKLLAIGYPA